MPDVFKDVPVSELVIVQRNDLIGSDLTDGNSGLVTIRASGVGDGHDYILTLDEPGSLIGDERIGAADADIKTPIR